jgi:hypothetical protein
MTQAPGDAHQHATSKRPPSQQDTSHEPHTSCSKHNTDATRHSSHKQLTHKQCSFSLFGGSGVCVLHIQALYRQHPWPASMIGVHATDLPNHPLLLTPTLSATVVYAICRGHHHIPSTMMHHLCTSGAVPTTDATSTVRHRSSHHYRPQGPSEHLPAIRPSIDSDV